MQATTIRLPTEVVGCIMRYVSHPCADLIRQVDFRQLNLVHVEADDLDTYDYDKLNDRYPVLTDRYGFVLRRGSVVTVIDFSDDEDDDEALRHFTLISAYRDSGGTGPVNWQLRGDNGIEIPAEQVELDDQEERATFCKHCYNHFKPTFEYARGCHNCNRTHT